MVQGFLSAADPSLNQPEQGRRCAVRTPVEELTAFTAREGSRLIPRIPLQPDPLAAVHQNRFSLRRRRRARLSQGDDTRSGCDADEREGGSHGRGRAGEVQYELPRVHLPGPQHRWKTLGQHLIGGHKASGIGRHHPVPPAWHLGDVGLHRRLDQPLPRLGDKKTQQLRLQPVDGIDRCRRVVANCNQQRLDGALNWHIPRTITPGSDLINKTSAGAATCRLPFHEDTARLLRRFQWTGWSRLDGSEGMRLDCNGLGRNSHSRAALRRMAVQRRRPAHGPFQDCPRSPHLEA